MYYVQCTCTCQSMQPLHFSFADDAVYVPGHGSTYACWAHCVSACTFNDVLEWKLCTYSSFMTFISPIVYCAPQSIMNNCPDSHARDIVWHRSCCHGNGHLNAVPKSSSTTNLPSPRPHALSLIPLQYPVQRPIGKSCMSPLSIRSTYTLSHNTTTTPSISYTV